MRWPALIRACTGRLLFGFLTGALLLVAMAFLSLVVIRQMNDRTTEADHAQVKASRAQKMLTVTAQSHNAGLGGIHLTGPAQVRRLSTGGRLVGGRGWVDDPTRRRSVGASWAEG